MEILQAIIHKIEKASKTTDNVSVEFKEELLPVEETLQSLVEEVLAVYNKFVNGYGSFDEDKETYPFSRKVESFYNDDVSFIQLSKFAVEQVAREIKGANFATGGYILCVRYISMGREWVMISMLKLRPSTGVNQETKELLKLLSLDVDRLHEAARIDINKWIANEEQYLSFVKKRSSGQDVTKYFRQALGCTDYTDSKHHTTILIAALNSYSKEKRELPENEGRWTREDARQARQKVFEYLQERSSAKEEVNLHSLSAALNNDEPEEFRDFIRDNGIPLSDVFSGHKNTYIKLRRISGKASGNVRVSFDIDDLVQNRVHHDVANNSLVICDVSEDLVDQIRKAQAGGEHDE